MTTQKWGPATKEIRQLAFLWLAAVLSSLALRPLWLALTPHLRPCIFRSLTGIPCPTCGTTRAATAFLRGDLHDAFIANPLATLVGIAFVVGGVIAGIWATARWPVPRTKISLPFWARVTTIGIILANWIYLITLS